MTGVQINKVNGTALRLREHAKQKIAKGGMLAQMYPLCYAPGVAAKIKGTFLQKGELELH
ncbi:hypothetical protein TR67_15795 [Pseudomonas deceptionensis]|nr:hypothetical protein TR67_15795 [Pseudomonas deceptionensis]